MTQQSKITIHIIEAAGCYHYSFDGESPAPQSRGYLSRSEATGAAITAALVRGLQIESLLGGDRKTARALGITIAKQASSTAQSPAPNGLSLSPAKRATLARAQAAHRDAIEQHRASLVCPEGFRSLDHFLDSVAERAGRHFGGQGDLARYLGTNSKSVSRWLRKQQYPLQATIDAMAKWYLGKTRGVL